MPGRLGDLYVAHSKSAQKRVRQNRTRRLRNRRRKAAAKASVREFDAAVAANKPNDAAETLRDVYKRIDRMASRSTIHKKTAARKKSRLAKRLGRAGKK